MQHRFAAYGDVTKPGNCKWCGRKLRKKWRREYPPMVLTWVEGDTRTQTPGCAVNTRVVTTVKVGEPTLGDYGDGHFCGLNCGYAFAVWFANKGNYIKPKKS